MKNKKHFIAPFIIINLGVIIITLIGHYNDKTKSNALLASVSNNHTSNLKKEVIHTMQTISSDLQFLANSKVLQAYINEPHSDNQKILSEEFASFAKSKVEYSQIRLINLKGQELARVNNENKNITIVSNNKLQDKASRYYFKKASTLNADEIYISPFDKNIENNDKFDNKVKKIIRFATPVFDKQGKKQGIVIINYLGENLMNSIRSSQKLNKIIVLNNSGDYLVDCVGSSNNFKNDDSIAWTAIKNNNSGFIETEKAIYVYQTIYPLSDGVVSLKKNNAYLNVKSNTNSYYWKVISVQKIKNNQIICLHFFYYFILCFTISLFLSFFIGNLRKKNFIIKMEKEKKEYELKLYKEIIDNSEAVIYAKNTKGEFVLSNPSMNSFISSKEPIIGKTYFDIFPDEIAEKLKQNDKEIIETEKSTKYEETVMKDGVELKYISLKFPIVNDKGIIIGVGGISTEITYLKNIENKMKLFNEGLIYQTEVAEKANKVKSEFLANMSHELRTPLNGITLPCQILKKMELTNEQNSFIDKISVSTNRLLNIVNKVLDLSKIEAGELVLEETEFTLSKIITNIKLIFIDQVKLKKLSFELINNIPEKTMFKADSNRLQQVIINLINNAIKFTKKGSITLTIDYKNIDNKDCLYCSVKDTGIGIKEESKSKLFKQFSQADSSITKEFGGTGLGLALSKKIINTMLGTISFKSEFGVGSTFYFYCPIKKLNKLDESAVLIRSELIKFKDIKVLLVEDDFINQEVLSFLLKERSCIVDIADNGLEAIEKIEKAQYDIVLMDIQMPVMDGETAVRAIRKMDEFASLPIIALTANAIKGDREKYLAAGMSDYITKPIDEEELMKVISNHIPSDLTTVVKTIQQQKTEHNEYPGFDSDTIKKIYSKKPEQFKRIHKEFTSTYQNIYLDIKSLYQENSKKELLSLVHKFKGTSGMLKANKIHLITKELELILKEDKDGFEDKLLEFEEEWQYILS